MTTGELKLSIQELVVKFNAENDSVITNIGINAVVVGVSGNSCVAKYETIITIK
jgi:hypothetical protein